MADVAISALPAVVTAAGTDTFPVVQAGTTKKETLTQALGVLLSSANTFTLGPNAFRAGNDANVALIARRHSASATANIQEWQNESGVALSVISKKGALGIGPDGVPHGVGYDSYLDIQDYTSSILSTTGTNLYGISVGLGPVTALNITAMYGLTFYTDTVGIAGTVGASYGVSGGAWHGSAATVNHLAGVYGSAGMYNAGNVNNQYGGYFQILQTGSGTATIGYGVRIDTPTRSSTGTWTTLYGLSIGTVLGKGAGTAYALHTAGGETRHLTGAAAAIGMVVQGFAAQSANLQEWQDSGSNNLSSISENGYYMTRKIAAPADAELATGELALWFDATAGAAKLMIKAKNASGTVVTGNVALT
jgi:hypothetical protein